MQSLGILYATFSEQRPADQQSVPPHLVVSGQDVRPWQVAKDLRGESQIGAASLHRQMQLDLQINILLSPQKYAGFQPDITQGRPRNELAPSHVQFSPSGRARPSHEFSYKYGTKFTQIRLHL